MVMVKYFYTSALMHSLKGNSGFTQLKLLPTSELTRFENAAPLLKPTGQETEAVSDLKE